jgi:hypothetical protein
MNVVIQKDIPAFHYPFRARILAILFVQSTEISDITKKADSTVYVMNTLKRPYFPQIAQVIS